MPDRHGFVKYIMGFLSLPLTCRAGGCPARAPASRPISRSESLRTTAWGGNGRVRGPWPSLGPGVPKPPRAPSARRRPPVKVTLHDQRRVGGRCRRRDRRWSHLRSGSDYGTNGADEMSRERGRHSDKIEVPIPIGLRSVCDAGDEGEQPAKGHQRRIIELANWRATPVPANRHYLVRHDLRWLA